MTNHLTTPARTARPDRAADLPHRACLAPLARDERGEGVISTGIAVLIMALLGAAMWVAFSGVFSTASDSIQDNVECTTSNSCTDTTGGGTGN